MANPEQLKEAQEQASRQVDLKQAYRELVTTFGGIDLIQYLQECYETSQNIAGNEMENMDKKALYLQDAHAYGKVLAYITDKAS